MALYRIVRLSSGRRARRIARPEAGLFLQSAPRERYALR